MYIITIYVLMAYEQTIEMEMKGEKNGKKWNGNEIGKKRAHCQVLLGDL